MSVSSRSSRRYNNGGGRVRVQTGVDERHLLEDEGERIMRWGERALLRVEVMTISKSEGRKVGGTSFWCHGGKRRKKQNDGQR
jgi:hypothetical protein